MVASCRWSWSWSWSSRVDVRGSRFSLAKTQLADFLTNGSFTRGAWNHLFPFVNIMDISKSSSSHFSSTSPQTMSKRLMQEEKPREDERVVAESKPMRNLVSKTVVWSPTALSSSASYSPGRLSAKSSNLDLTGTRKLVAIDSNENKASSSQVRQSDVNTSSNAGKHVAKTTNNPVRITSAILRKSTRTYDENLVINQKTICLRLTST